MSKPVIVIKPKVPAFLTIRTDILKKEYERAKGNLALGTNKEYNEAILYLIKDVLGLHF